jgi:hypothetical protein
MAQDKSQGSKAAKKQQLWNHPWISWCIPLSLEDSPKAPVRKLFSDGIIDTTPTAELHTTQAQGCMEALIA